MKDVIETIGDYVTDSRAFKIKTCNNRACLCRISVSVSVSKYNDEMWDEIVEVWVYKKSSKEYYVTNYAYKKVCLSSDMIDIEDERILDMFEDHIKEMFKRVLERRNRLNKNNRSRY